MIHPAPKVLSSWLNDFKNYLMNHPIYITLSVAFLFFSPSLFAQTELLIDENTFEVGGSAVSGNIFDNDSLSYPTIILPEPPNGTAAPTPGHPLHAIPNPPNNSITYLYWPSVIWGYFENSGTGGKLSIGVNGAYSYLPSSSDLPGGASYEDYEIFARIGTTEYSNTLRFWQDLFRVEETPEITVEDLSTTSGLVGFAEDAAYFPFNNSPEARTAQMTIEDFMDRSYAFVRASQIEATSPSLVVEQFPSPGSLGPVTGWNNPEFNDPNDSHPMIETGPAYSIPLVGTGYFPGTALVAPRDGLYRYEASLATRPLVDLSQDPEQFFDSDNEREVFYHGIEIMILAANGGSAIGWNGRGHAYEMDSNEDADEFSYLFLEGLVRLNEGDRLLLLAHQIRKTENNSYMIGSQNEINDRPDGDPYYPSAFPFFQMQWIAD